jgi:ribosomal large subunit pseudouridine synthase C (EC 5.4.99.-)
VSGVRNTIIPEELAGQRIDNYLLRELKGVPRTRVYRLLRRGEVRVNGGGLNQRID